MIGQAGAPVANIGNIEAHVVRDLTLHGQRPVLVTRQSQPVLRDCDGSGSVRDGWIDEGREFDLVLWEPLIQMEGRCLAIVCSLGKRAGRKPESRLTDELSERNPGIVNPIASADGRLVTHSIGKTEARAKVVQTRILKRPLSGAAWAFSCKDHGAREIAGTWVRGVRIKRRILIVHLGACGLVVEAQP